MQSQNLSYLPRLDHLRFVAAMLVLVFHVYHYFFHGWKPNPDAAAIGFIVEGHTGVALFFTLSGFLFMLIGQQGPIDYKNFLYNRFVRIFPLFLVVFYLAISLGRDDFSATDIGYLFFSNIGTPPTSDFFVTGAAWTISVEFTFYLIFPFLCRFFLEGGFRYMAGLLTLLLLMKVCAYLIVENPVHVLYSTLVGRLDQFLLGMVAGRLYLLHQRALKRIAIPVLLTGVVLLYVALFMLARHASWMSPDPHQPLWIIWSAIEALCWSLVIVGYLSVAPWRSGLARWCGALMRWGGKVSYSFYLLHAIVLFLFQQWLGVWMPTPWFAVNYLLNVIVITAGCLAVASLSFRCIESPFLKLRRRYVDSR